MKEPSSPAPAPADGGSPLQRWLDDLFESIFAQDAMAGVAMITQEAYLTPPGVPTPASADPTGMSTPMDQIVPMGMSRHADIADDGSVHVPESIQALMEKSTPSPPPLPDHLLPDGPVPLLPPSVMFPGGLLYEASDALAVAILSGEVPPADAVVPTPGAEARD